MSKLTINQILKKGLVDCRYGAPLGAKDFAGGGYNLGNLDLCIQKVRIDSQGYAPDGTYWGGGDPLYCGFNSGGAGDPYLRGQGFRFYARAKKRSESVVSIKRRVRRIV